MLGMAITDKIIIRRPGNEAYLAFFDTSAHTREKPLDHLPQIPLILGRCTKPSVHLIRIGIDSRIVAANFQARTGDAGKAVKTLTRQIHKIRWKTAQKLSSIVNGLRRDRRGCTLHCIAARKPVQMLRQFPP